jgi:glycosyltransferase involved in cell wall biosynthesis
MSETGYPAVIPRFSFENVENRKAACSWREAELPGNIRIASDGGTRDELIQSLRGARVVVVPTRKTSLCASGVGTYLNAMYLKKCVVLTDGPGASDVLRDEAVIVPPESPRELGAAIRKVWDDDAYRCGFEERGHRYALSVGGADQLIARIVARVVNWLRTERDAQVAC